MVSRDSAAAGPYRPVTPSIVAELRSLVGQGRVIHGDREALMSYSHDETAGPEHAHLPEVVVKAGSTAEVAAIMALANRELVPVTPRGAGSGLSCGAVPLFGGILLSLERMNRILEVDRGNMVVVVQPAVVTNDIGRAVQEEGFFYAGYPMSRQVSFIGGNVAENAGGGRAIKYGVTGHHVLGLEVVLPTAEVVRLGGRRLKDVTGYDLLHLMVGSEGTLGIFTEITLRLLPRPGARVVLLVPFPNAATAVAAVPRVMTQSHIIPSSVEFMDGLSVKVAYEHLAEAPPHPAIGAMLLLEVDGASQDQAETEAIALADLCTREGALDAYVGTSPTAERRMWRPREALAEAFKAVSPVQSLEDVVVPPATIPDLIARVQDLARDNGVLIPCYGHAADGNIHATVLKPPEMLMETWNDRLPGLLRELYRTVIALGGTISGEHGIGSKRAPYLNMALEPALLSLLKRVKHAFDPLHILNPGKILPGS